MYNSRTFEDIPPSQKPRKYKQSISILPLRHDHTDSKELLLEKSSLCSGDHLIYDNHGYMSSLEQLLGINNNHNGYSNVLNNLNNGTKKNVNTLSRSLDTLKDFLNDSSLLPGSVMSSQTELSNDTCTVRDVLLDDSSACIESEEKSLGGQQPHTAVVYF